MSKDALTFLNLTKMEMEVIPGETKAEALEVETNTVETKTEATKATVVAASEVAVATTTTKAMALSKTVAATKEAVDVEVELVVETEVAVATTMVVVTITTETKVAGITTTLALALDLVVVVTGELKVLHKTITLHLLKIRVIRLKRSHNRSLVELEVVEMVLLNSKEEEDPEVVMSEEDKEEASETKVKATASQTQTNPSEIMPQTVFQMDLEVVEEVAQTHSINKKVLMQPQASPKVNPQEPVFTYAI